MYTELHKTCQGPALVLSLGEAQDVALESTEDEVAEENRVDTILRQLDRMFKKDSTITKYQALEVFQKFERPSNYGCVMSEDIPAYRLLKSANLSNHHQQLKKGNTPWTAIQFDEISAKENI